MEHNWTQQSLRASNLLSRSINKSTALSPNISIKNVFIQLQVHTYIYIYIYWWSLSVKRNIRRFNYNYSLFVDLQLFLLHFNIFFWYRCANILDVYIYYIQIQKINQNVLPDSILTYEILWDILDITMCVIQCNLIYIYIYIYICNRRC